MGATAIMAVLAEGIADTAVETLERAGIVRVERLSRALSPADVGLLASCHLLGIRSRTKATAELLDLAPEIMAVGCFSVGTNQVDLAAARARGIPVFNAPFSNTRSVAELTIGEIVMLLRRILPRSAMAHAGGWDKSATGSFEVRGKTLGIVGYGNIGAQLSNLAEAMGMRVVYHDLTDKLRHGNTEPLGSLAELLATADVVSLHVPETEATKGMIGEAEIRAMRRGSYLVNNSRGTVVDLDALAAALRDGHLTGAAVDVFPVEPTANGERFESPLQGIPNVILTPHVGGSTEEAQERIGAEVARKLADFALSGTTVGTVNFPLVQVPSRRSGTRFLHVHANAPGLLRHVNDAFARRGLNIAAQGLQTDGELGYVVVEAEGAVPDPEGLLAEMRAIPGTVRARYVQVG